MLGLKGLITSRLEVNKRRYQCRSDSELHFVEGFSKFLGG